MHADPAFLHDLEEAKKVLASIRANKLEPERDCQAEAEAMADDPFQVP